MRRDLNLPPDGEGEREPAYKAVLRCLKNGARLSEIQEVVQLICSRLGFGGFGRIES